MDMNKILRRFIGSIKLVIKSEHIVLHALDAIWLFLVIIGKLKGLEFFITLVGVIWLNIPFIIIKGRDLFHIRELFIWILFIVISFIFISDYEKTLYTDLIFFILVFILGLAFMVHFTWILYGIFSFIRNRNNKLIGQLVINEEHLKETIKKLKIFETYWFSLIMIIYSGSIDISLVFVLISLMPSLYIVGFFAKRTLNAESQSEKEKETKALTEIGDHHSLPNVEKHQSPYISLNIKILDANKAPLLSRSASVASIIKCRKA